MWFFGVSNTKLKRMYVMYFIITNYSWINLRYRIDTDNGIIIKYKIILYRVSIIDFILQMKTSIIIKVIFTYIYLCNMHKYVCIYIMYIIYIH